MLLQINKTLERMMPIITPTGVIIGVLLSSYLSDFSFLVPWLFAFMTFEGSLSMNFRSIKNAITHPLPVFTTLFFLHIFMPLWALGISHIAFSADTLTITGILLSMVIPTGVTSFIWVAIKQGNKALTLTVILIDALISPLIVPFSLSLLVGQTVELNTLNMMTGLLYMIVLPSIIGMLLNQWTRGKIQSVWKPRLAPISKVFLGIVVMLNGAVVAPYLKEMQFKLILIILVVLFIAFSGYLISFYLGKFLKYDKETIITVTFMGGMRNISSGAVIAIAYFPPPVVIPVVVAMLFQQILASFFSHFLDKRLLNKHNNIPYNSPETNLSK